MCRIDIIGRLRIKRKCRAGAAVLLVPRPYPPISNQRLFGRQRPRSAFNSSLARSAPLCKNYRAKGGEKAACYVCRIAACQSASERSRSATRFCPQQGGRKKGRQQSFHRYRIAPQISHTDHLHQIFCTTKTFCAINLLPDPYWAKNVTLDVRRKLAKFKRAQRS